MSQGGITLLLTRPRPQLADWTHRLQAQGVQVAPLPLIDIAPPASADAVRAAWQRLPGCALAVFVSPNAVDGFFALQPADRPWPETLAACVGPGSARALAARGVPAELIVQPAADAASLDSEHLWLRLQARDWRGRRVLLLRGNGGREWLAERLTEAGAEVEAVSVYCRAAPVLDAAERLVLARALAEPASHAWLLSSAEAVGHLQQLLAAAGPSGAAGLSGQRAIATHERIAAAASAAGFAPVVLTRPDPAAIAAALQAF